jgi:hypothetical protein
LISGFPAGGPNDLVARLMGQWLSERLGQQFVIENRPGAGSNIATEAVVRAAPDGHSLLIVATPNAINATLYDKLNFNFIRDIAPVASIMRVPNLMVVHRGLLVRQVRLDHKARPERRACWHRPNTRAATSGPPLANLCRWASGSSLLSMATAAAQASAEIQLRRSLRSSCR